MENNKNVENPSAFPLLSPTDKIMNEGMTLRDYFANSAMQGIISNNEEINRIKHLGLETNGFIAKISYSIADAMLVERSVSPK